MEGVAYVLNRGLQIDTRDGFPPEEHTVEIVQSAIDEFVARCKIGFCY